MRSRISILICCCIVFLSGTNCLALSIDDARHLLSRSGFSPGAKEIQALLPMDRDASVQWLISTTRTEGVTAPPDWINDFPGSKRPKEMNAKQRKSFMQERRKQILSLKSWWYGEMIKTDSPLTEHMTLFWHNHFTSSVKKVKSPYLMYRQNVLLRQHALGNFQTLLHAVAKDPAMILYLDNVNNRKQQPNENFTRELLELFTLGEGYYSEQDIKEAARAFTGWTVNRNTGEFRLAKRQHDDGLKVFMGQQGMYSGDDILELLLANPRVAEFITEKLWKEFISNDPEEMEVKRLAAIFQSSDYEMEALLKAMFNSAFFWSPKNRASLIKSPVDLLVGIVRTFNPELADHRILAFAGRSLGQDIFDPPNVKGWSGGQSWITSDSLMARQQVISRVTQKINSNKDRSSNSSNSKVFPSLSSQEIMQILLPMEPVNEFSEINNIHDLIARVIADPVYQLK